MPRSKQAIEPPSDGSVFKEPGEDPEYDTWLREQVQIGIDQADRGEMISNEDMQRWFSEQRATLLRKIEEQKET